MVDIADIIETKEYGDDHITLWQDAFGDSREDVLFFLDNAMHISCLCLYDKSTLCSMLFLVDCTVKGKAYKYIYAACTDKEYRAKGCMSELLNYAKAQYDNIVLIPADDLLVDYYSKRGFNHKIEIDRILFNECTEIKEYLLEGCSLKNPFALAYNIGE